MSETTGAPEVAPVSRFSWVPLALLAVGAYAVLDVAGQALVVPTLPGSVGKAGWSVLTQTILFNSGLLLLGFFGIGIGLGLKGESRSMRRAAVVLLVAAGAVAAVVLLFLLTSDAGVFLGARPTEGAGDPSRGPFWRAVGRGLLTAVALFALGLLALSSRGLSKDKTGS